MFCIFVCYFLDVGNIIKKRFTLSDQFQNPFEKSEKDAKSIT